MCFDIQLTKQSLYRGAIVLVMILVLIPGHSQTGSRNPGPTGIQGLWQNSQFGYQMTLMMNPDGTGEFDGEPIRYTVKGKSLSIIIGDSETIYEFTQQGNALTLSGGDLNGKVTFQRNGLELSQKPAAGAAPAYSGTSTKLIGLWSGNGEMIDFKPDGTCVYLGNTFPYKVSQGNIILTTAQGPVTFAYSVKGGQLTMIANGRAVVYNKAATSGPQKPSAGGGHIATELVGEWCYLNMNSNSQTSRCITLRADGTYYYTEGSSRSVNTDAISGGTASQGEDRGTWYVEGGRIYYQSQSKGAGSYRLEKRNHPKNVNDPMIILDGEPYVTTTNRAPWR
jgi:hypothetical protein